MSTTTTKELRDNLADIRRRVMSGETIEVIYRSRPVMRLTPIETPVSRFTGDQVGPRLDALLKQSRSNISVKLRDPNKTYKQLRDEAYRDDPKYRKYFSQPASDD